MNGRVYLDWNATAPLRPEARAAMLAAMDVVGNPSSVHAEGRAAKAIVERARGQVAGLVGCEPSEVVFTSGATEAAALAVASVDHVYASPVEHDSVYAHGRNTSVVGLNSAWTEAYCVNRHGVVSNNAASGIAADDSSGSQLFAVQTANSETGVLQPEPFPIRPCSLMRDITQSVFRVAGHDAEPAALRVLSGHKLGCAKGAGALVGSEKALMDLTERSFLKGGGQELGRRSGTENVIGIAGFGAAAAVARRDLEDGIWDRVEKLRNILEDALADVEKEIIFVGKEVARLPNTSCFITPGWKGETQVMQMDLAGYAISAGSACSSGKVKESRVLRAMGFDEVHATSAVRVSLGPTTTEDEVLGFARSWGEHFRRWRNRRAA